MVEKRGALLSADFDTFKRRQGRSVLEYLVLFSSWFLMREPCAGTALLDHFAALEDPCQAAKALHPLPEILPLLLGATLAGADAQGLEQQDRKLAPADTATRTADEAVKSAGQAVS